MAEKFFGETLKEVITGIHTAVEEFELAGVLCSFNNKGECRNPDMPNSGVREVCSWNRCPYGKED